MKNLVIIGTGGFAREVYWLARKSVGFDKEYTVKGFVEGDAPVSEERLQLLSGPFFGRLPDYDIEPDDVFVIAIADSQVKEKLAKLVTDKGGRFTNVIAESAFVAPTAELGTDIVLCQNTFVSDHVSIGNHVVINVASGVGHDSCIGDYSSLMGGVSICGGVQVGSYTYWGTGSIALPHSRIGNHANVGTNSLILRKVKNGRTVFGSPAVYID